MTVLGIKIHEWPAVAAWFEAENGAPSGDSPMSRLTERASAWVLAGRPSCEEPDGSDRSIAVDLWDAMFPMLRDPGETEEFVRDVAAIDPWLVAHRLNAPVQMPPRAA